MSMNLVTLLYLIASVCFIQALKGLSHPTTSRRGNLFGMVGMAIAVATTVGLVFKLGAEIATTGVGYIVVGLLVGGTAGSIMAKRVEMTKMPELVAFMHSMIGLAAVFIAIAAVVEPQSLGIVAHLGDTIPTGNRLELFLGAAIGAITFSGSVIAFGKLSGKYKFRLFQGTPVQFSGQHLLNLVLGLATLGLGLVFMFTGNLTAFAVMLALAFVLGVLIIIPIGGADMPVVVSMLNSYSGWAAAGIGFSLNNSMLIIAGSLVGSSGAILSYIMCKAMNRSFFNVILGGGGAPAHPGGVRLVVLDAWRPFAVQQYLYDSLSSALAAHYPRAGEAELERLTRQFVSPPSSSREAPSPHLTGGAVDVTLCDAQGRWLDMGSAFDEAVPASYTAYFERLAEPDARQRRVRDHRRLLYHAMLDAGFSNLPSEWWHYDFGDQLWAWHTGATQALFGPVQLQAMDALWRQQLQKRPPAD